MEGMENYYIDINSCGKRKKIKYSLIAAGGIATGEGKCWPLWFSGGRWVQVG